MNGTSASTGEVRQLAIFVVAGGTSAVFNLATRWVLSFFLVYELAIALAYVVGVTTAFLLTRHYVFAAGQGWVGEFGRFALVNVISFLMVLGVSVGLARGIFPAIGFAWHAEDVAHFLGVASPTLFSFYAHKHFSFRRREPQS